MNTFDRRYFLSQLTLAGAAVATAGFGFTTTRKSDEFVEVEIVPGKIRGVRNDGVSVFKGIPYGGKISGERRFRRPAPLEPWTSVRDATQFGAPAIQGPRRNEPAPSEDCLFLNVWTPANDNKKRPVMF